tara:strand:- start:15150 stop:16094 length:945 start_codon:yes stop_codon:yes gene_type:complete
MLALDIKGLKKTYKNGFEALNGIDLQVKQGDFFGLLGPNGAGKSTTIGIITSLVTKTGGTVSVFEHDIDKSLSEAKRCIGLVPQEFNFNLFEKAIDIVVSQAGYYGVPRKKAQERAEYYLQKLGLWDKRNERSRFLSGGMKRRLMIARALAHDPKLLILDEPTAGVDIELRRSLWGVLEEINQQGTTIILTTHYLEEAESLCRNIAIIDNGDIIQNTSTKALLAELDSETFVFDIDPVAVYYPKLDGVQHRYVNDHTLEVDVRREDDLNQLFVQFSANDIHVKSMRNKANRLEELFVRLVGQPVPGVKVGGEHV